MSDLLSFSGTISYLNDRDLSALAQTSKSAGQNARIILEQVNAARTNNMERLVLSTNLADAEIVPMRHKNVTYYAALNNNLKMLKYATQICFPKHKDVTIIAARQNHDAIFKYATEMNYFKDRFVLFHFVINHNFPMVKYATEHGYHKLNLAMYEALKLKIKDKNDHEIFDYMLSQGYTTARTRWG